MKKETKQKENGWIDVHNDDIMREMGFRRPFDQKPRDNSVWTKTANERRLLKKLRHSIKADMHFNMIPPKRATMKAKLIVRLKPNKVFEKSTYSQECLNTRILDALEKFETVKNGKVISLVSSYSYNGRTYYI